MKPQVTFETLKSKPLNPKAIEKGEALFRANLAEHWVDDDEFGFMVDDHGEERRGRVRFTRDGTDLSHHFCLCNPGRNGVICKHIVAAVLEIQSGIVETRITLGKTATITSVVTEADTAQAVGSGDLPVLATPILIALMERAACAVLSDGYEHGQTSVGMSINVEHSAPTPIGAEVRITATIESVNGRIIEFEVSACDSTGEVGRGKHTRVIVDSVRFMKKAAERQA